MTVILETSKPLTADEQRKLEAYAESLIAQRPVSQRQEPPTYLNVDAIAGMFAGLAPEKSDVELADEAKEIICKKYAKYFE